MTKDDTPQGVTKGIGLLLVRIKATISNLGLREQLRLRSQPCFGTLDGGGGVTVETKDIAIIATGSTLPSKWTKSRCSR